MSPKRIFERKTRKCAKISAENSHPVENGVTARRRDAMKRENRRRRDHFAGSLRGRHISNERGALRKFLKNTLKGTRILFDGCIPNFSQSNHYETASRRQSRPLSTSGLNFWILNFFFCFTLFFLFDKRPIG